MQENDAMTPKQEVKKSVNVCGVLGFILSLASIIAYIAGLVVEVAVQNGIGAMVWLYLGGMTCSGIAVVGIVLSIIGVVQRKKRRLSLFAVLGLLIGIVGLVPIALIVVATFGLF